MRLPTQFIYVLTLQSNKYYVGFTNDVNRRFQEHQNGKGSAWTRRYPPMEIQKQYRVAPGRHAALEEDAQVKHMMMKHGIDHVRGGSYANIQLSPTQLNELKRSLRHAESTCLRCGRKGHFADQCNVKEVSVDCLSQATATTRNLNAEQVRPAWNSRPQHSTRRVVVCECCGRNNHTADRCYATFDTKGKKIARRNTFSKSVASEKRTKKPECKRCGRKTHTADRCYAIFDVHGASLQADPIVSATRTQKVGKGPLSACERCGRNTHTTARCYAILNIHGLLIDKQERPNPSLKDVHRVNYASRMNKKEAAEENFKHIFRCWVDSQRNN